MRDLELLAACEELKLERLVKWLMQILERPADVCEVAALPPDVYVHMARKLLVTFEGPPTPSCFSPRASFNLGHRSSTGPLASFLPAPNPGMFGTLGTQATSPPSFFLRGGADVAGSSLRSGPSPSSRSRSIFARDCKSDVIGVPPTSASPVSEYDRAHMLSGMLRKATLDGGANGGGGGGGGFGIPGGRSAPRRAATERTLIKDRQPG